MYKSSKDFLSKNKHIAKRIKNCTQNLQKAFHPEKIILFGSFARGEGDDTKTIDIIIIAKTKLRFFDRIKKALTACSGGNPSIEPLVYTPKEIQLLQGQGEGFIEEAFDEGIVLFDKTKSSIN